MSGSRSKINCWAALACLVVPMFASYFFDDMFSTLSQLFKNPELLELGWDSADYGFYAGGYSFLCVFGGLVICGILLDIFGVRLIGSVFVALMALGAGTVFVAIRSGLDPKVTAEMYALIDELNKDGITIIMISHDISAAVKYASHILHISQKVFFGTKEDYLNSPAGKLFLAQKGGENA